MDLQFQVSDVHEYEDPQTNQHPVTGVKLSVMAGGPVGTANPVGTLDLVIVDPSVAVNFHVGQVYHMTLERIQ